ncbi:MAG: hypothetical protein FWE37_02170 [Spirochaetaceae bacterium]|nr:hypothetical protein [Spirochaetaceae bacterium]
MKIFKVLALCLVTLIGSHVFAMDMAVGGGILFNQSSTSGSISGDGIGFPGESVDWRMSRSGFGAFGFFGLGQNWEFNLGFLYKNPGTVREEWSDGYTDSYDASDWFEAPLALQIGIYYKYPIVLNERFVIFPTAGVDFEYTIGGNGENDFIDETEWWHELWVRAGVGLDTFITETMFIRTHLIYGVGPALGGSDSLGASFSHGLLVKIGLGVMF